MMSSEEETDCGQGPSCASSTQQQQQHGHASAFGFFGAQGFGPPNKMLNELFGRQVKQATDAGASPPEGGHGMAGAAASLEASGASPLLNCGDDSALAGAPELTQHMLREILQELLKSQQLHQQRGDPGSPTTQLTQQNNGDSAGARSAIDADDESDDGEGLALTRDDVASTARAMEEAFAEAGMEPGANLDASDCDASLPSSPTGGPRSVSVHSVKEEQLHDSIKRSPSHSPCPLTSAMHKQQSRAESPTALVSSAGAEIKRARVENIVSTMRSSPAPQPQQPPPPIVNGCKKRKLYQPQQQTAHHVLSQHAVVVCNDVAMLSAGDDDESDTDDDYLTIRQKREEKATLKSQLNKLNREIAVMQQKWAELASRMNSEILSGSGSGAGGTGTGSTAGDVSPPEPALSPVPSREQHQPQQPLQVAASLAQMQAAAAAAAVAGHQQPASARHHRGHHVGPTPYNGAFASMSHEQAAAAAMYQMVNHKFYLEQERYASTVERLKQQQQHHEAVSRQQEAANRQQQEAALAMQASRQQQQQQQQLQQQHQQQHHHHHHQQPQPQGSPQPRQEGSSSTSSSAPQTPRLQKSTTPLPQQPKDLQESLVALRGAVELASSAGSSSPSITVADLELLADKVKSEILHHFSNLVDGVFQRFLQQKKFLDKQADATQVAADQLSNINKDLMLANQYLERKSPRTKVVDRGAQQPQGPSVSGPRSGAERGSLSNGGPTCSQLGGFSPIGPGPLHPASLAENNLNQLNQLPHPHSLRPSASMFQQPKPPTIFSMANSIQQQREQFCAGLRDERESRDSEQNEALSLVMTPKKKRHKVTDTRITPRTVSRMLGGSAEGSESPPPGPVTTATALGASSGPPSLTSGAGAATPGSLPGPVSGARGVPAPPPSAYHTAPPMLPVSLPTSVAIPNPSLHESQVFSPYSPFFSAAHPGQAAPPGSHHLPASPPSGGGGAVGLGPDARDQSPPPLHPPPTMLHPALLAAAQHGGPDFGHLRIDSSERSSDCNSADIGYDGIQPTISFDTYKLLMMNILMLIPKFHFLDTCRTQLQ
ncbi:hypothetical protein QAD02_005355 [Eretmocerus hayati]|uniref:Uncharacterized protein n=1 Tax=Eretmocerus hayati TaxID=131215 RepID=A0ACC2NS96_9HYME|nr:hypothetical protein QAD02_005355 [Eretmocerus hayati]